ncbi:MAG: hypothetical protein JXA42_06040 [Anaerolineales bacterium]|nr:hypothetical protein [Anaerolineales bacterium]
MEGYLETYTKIVMQAVIFIGIQATGKSTFFKERFFNTHVRISLDLLKTRNPYFGRGF